MSGPIRVDCIRVDWIDTALWPGRLGLTFAPGKKGASLLQPGVVHDRDMAQDFATLAREGVNILAPLIEDFEFQELSMANYHQQAEAAGIVIAPCPIRDRNVPGDLSAFRAFVDELMDALLDGRNVVVHCRGGLGRAGLTAACLLIQAGMSAPDAEALVRRTRPGAIENQQQEAFLRQFEGPGG